MDSFKTVFDPLDLEIMDQVMMLRGRAFRRVSPPAIPRRIPYARRRYAEGSLAWHVSQAPDTSTSTLSLRWCLQ